MAIQHSSPARPSHRLLWWFVASSSLLALICMLNRTHTASPHTHEGDDPVIAVLERNELNNRLPVFEPQYTAVWLSSFLPSYSSSKGEEFYIRRRRPQNDDKKNSTKQRLSERFLIGQDEWEEDDDDVGNILPFHLEDDDATAQNEAQSTSSNNDQNMSNEDDVVNNIEVKPGGNDSQQSGSMHPPPPPPPPPRPTQENEDTAKNDNPNTKNENTAKSANTKQNNNEAKEQTDDKKQPPKSDTTNDNNRTNQTKNTQNKKHHHFNKSNNNDDDHPADTIMDDILRGFSFATIFCMIILCLHRACWYTCVKCGIFPDERVLEARWRRLQLKNKRAYFDPHSHPPLDPKGLGAWMMMKAKHDRYGGGGVWDSITDDVERDMAEWEDRSAGALSFDDDGIALMTWEDHDGEMAVCSRDDESGSTEMELEYGEGVELEDKSHDSRLFDDRGSGVEQEASKFFSGARNSGSGNSSNNRGAKRSSIPRSEASSISSSGSGVKMVQPKSNPQKKDDKNMSDDAFFDALQPPSGNSVDSFPADSKSSNSQSNPKDFVLEQLKTNNDQALIYTSDDKEAKREGDDEDGDDNDETDQIENSFIADDRGYDEDADLLGLRSDSPPPLDLEEIEKTLVENMEKAKYY